MPLYGYRCESCGESFEVLQKSADADNPSCPGCDSDRTVRLLSTPAPPVVRDGAADRCCGDRGGCENPKRCCEKRP